MKIIRQLLKHDRTRSGNRFGQCMCEHEQLCSERTAPHAANSTYKKLADNGNFEPLTTLIRKELTTF
jgi:hypothetical protein